jgi:uncharacterized LabA/DUF88 family protein
MKNTDAPRMVRVACFYDGSFFVRVSNFYKHYHDRKSYLSFTGIHEFIRQRVAEYEGTDRHMVQMIQSHFFRGRFSLQAAKTANALEADRYFDQLLMYAGIVSHYYPMNESVMPPQEKGIDVWLALEAMDLAVTNGFDVLALVVSDQDFLPLIRKMHARKIRTLVLQVDIRYTDTQGIERSLATSHQLTNEATYALNISEEIERAGPEDLKLIDSLFAVPAKNPYTKPALTAPKKFA